MEGVGVLCRSRYQEGLNWIRLAWPGLEVVGLEIRFD